MSEIVSTAEHGWYHLDIHHFGAFVLKAADEEAAWDRLREYGREANGTLCLNPDVLPTMRQATHLNGQGMIYEKRSPENLSKVFIERFDHVLPHMPAIVFGTVSNQREHEAEQLTLDMDLNSRFSR